VQFLTITDPLTEKCTNLDHIIAENSQERSPLFMEASTIQIRYDSEKLRVLGRYMKDESELTERLESFMQTLYKRHVPADVRESIERKKEGNAV
jgi:hypothetical protein